MKPDYLISGMPSEVERVMNIHKSSNPESCMTLMDARQSFKYESDYLAIRENDTKQYKINKASIDLLKALEAAIKYIPHRNVKALWMAKNAIDKAYNG